MTEKEAAEILKEEITYQKSILGDIKNPVIEALEMAAAELASCDGCKNNGTHFCYYCRRKPDRKDCYEVKKDD